MSAVRTARARRARLALLSSVLLAAGAAGADLNASVIATYPFVGDAQVNADGTRIAYVVQVADTARDDYQSDIWLIEGDAAPRLLIGGPADDARPRWAPDGSKLAFLSSRAGKKQIYILEMRGGEAWPLTREAEGVGGFAWSPDSRRIAYLAASPVERPPAGAAGRAFVTERQFYRFDGAPGFLPSVRAKIWVTDVLPAPGPAIGPLWDGRTEPSEPVWTPDGKALVFSSLPSPDPPAAPGDTELFRVRVAADSVAEMLTRRRGPDDGPLAMSRTGRVAWTGYDEATPLRSSTTTRLYVGDTSTAVFAPRVASGSLDRNVNESVMTDMPLPRGAPPPRPAFTGDGRSMIFIAADQGLAQLHRVGTDGGAVERVSPALRGDLREFTLSRSGRIAAVFGSPTQPYEVWTLERPGARWVQRTAHTSAAIDAARLAPYEEFWIDSFDGTRIQGWLLKPPGFDPARKHPLLLYIHGGPHAMYGESFFYEFQALANAGLLVLITNPRGSTGYGEAFANSVQYRYPGDDYRDLMAALDHVIARGYVDPARLGVAGGSGGGVLTSWTIGQTDRFAAALVERPVVNFASHAMVADLNGRFSEIWFRDYPWRSPQEYFERSPVNLVDRVQTPVLVIQSVEDYRTPIDQGLAYYNALRILGKPAKLVLFPTSSHGLSRNGPPSQRTERLEIITEWFTTRLGSPPPAAPRSAAD